MEVLVDQLSLLVDSGSFEPYSFDKLVGRKEFCSRETWFYGGFIILTVVILETHNYIIVFPSVLGVLKSVL